MPKEQRPYSIDAVPVQKTGLVTSDDTPTQSRRPPAGRLPEPDNLNFTAELDRSDRSVTCIITGSWDTPPGSTPQGYQVQIARDENFSRSVQIYNTTEPFFERSGFADNKEFFIRVRVIWRELVSAWSDPFRLLTPTDTSEAALPTNVTVTWSNAGDAELRWTNPPDEHFKTVSIVIRSGGTTLRTIESATGRYVYTVFLNGADGQAGVYYPSLTFELRSVTWAGVVSQNATILTRTKPKPADIPAAAVSTSFFGRDLAIDWPDSDNASIYRLTLDGVTRRLTSSFFTYTFDQNAKDHDGTPEPQITWSLVALDALGQESANAATGVAINQPPDPPTDVTIIGGQLGTFIVDVTAVQPLDFQHFTYRLTRDGFSYSTFQSTANEQTIGVRQNGLYIVYVSVVDSFGQASAEVSAAQDIETLTIEDLREDARYADSAGNTADELAKLKDGNAASNGVVYNATMGWNWTRVTRPITDRYKFIQCTTNLNISLYVKLEGRGVTRWLSGPVVLDELQEVADEATAQTRAATLHAFRGNNQINLPEIMEAYQITLYHQRISSDYRIYELYPWRFIQADYIEAEELSAITANLGEVTAGTITSLFIRTATSGRRTEMDPLGFRTYSSNGAQQIEIATDGSGAMKLPMAIGSRIRSQVAYALNWLRNDALQAYFAGLVQINTANPYLAGAAGGEDVGKPGAIFLTAGGISATGTAALALLADDHTGNTQSEARITAEQISLTGGSTRINRLRVGQGTNPFENGYIGANKIRLETSVGIGSNPGSSTRLSIKGINTSSTTNTIFAQNSSNQILFYIRNNGSGYLRASAWTHGSDERIKDIRGISPYGLAAIRQIQPIAFDYHHGPQNQIGFSAQNVQTVIPEAVEEVEEQVDDAGTVVNTILGLTTIPIIAALVTAVQEQQHQLDQQQQQIAALQSAVAALAQRLNES